MADGSNKPLVFLAMPTYDGRCSLTAAQAYDLFPTRGGCEPVRAHSSGSLLCRNFNSLLAAALNLRKAGVEYFAMIHDDLAPFGASLHGWLDQLLGVLREHDADLVAAVSPIKSDAGLTSTAVAEDLGDPWDRRRLTMHEVYQLPETFGAADVGGPLLLNTGLWVGKLAQPWWDELEPDGKTLKLRFTIKDRIIRGDDGEYHAQVISEDWLFSQELNRRGAKLLATRKVILEHQGGKSYTTDRPWGELQTDEAYRKIRARRDVKASRNGVAKEPVCA